MTALAIEPYGETVFGSSCYDSSEEPAHFMNRSRFWMGRGTSYTNTKLLTRELNVLSTSQIVQWMRDDGLPISIIADVMNVERKSIYAWLKGSISNEYNRERLEQIHSLLSENKTASLRNLYRFWNRKVLDDKSLAILLREIHLDKQSIRIVLKCLWHFAKKEQDREIKQISPITIMNNPILRESRVVVIVEES